MALTNAKDVMGMELVAQDGRAIGKLVGLDLDLGEWRVAALLVRLHREVLEDLNLKRPLLGTQQMRVPAQYVAGVGDVILLSRKLSELEKIAEPAEPEEAAVAEDVPETAPPLTR